LQHMLEASRDAVSFTQNKDRGSLDADKMLCLSIVRCIEIIGEAASRLSPECQTEFPQIPWKNIINMRNRLIHPNSTSKCNEGSSYFDWFSEAQAFSGSVVD